MTIANPTMPQLTRQRPAVYASASQPTSLNEIAEYSRTSRKLLPIGGLTKSALALGDEPPSDISLIDMRGYSGVVSYDPSEFLISARGGTTLAELASVLEAQGQYLPYDPVLIAGGSTLGGSIASGISGPCRLLYGSLRDFIMEVALCDGAGREIRGGGKVVKNAAGFDLPKLVVGSYGRMGIITEATLKVFPKPQGWITLCIECGSLRSALEQSMKLLAMPLPIAAMEIEVGSRLLVRLAGPIDSLDGMSARIKSQTLSRHQLTVQSPGADEIQLWRERSEFAWTEFSGSSALLIRVATAHHQCQELARSLAQWNADEVRCVFSCAAAVAWLAVSNRELLPAIDAQLAAQKLSGVVVRGVERFTLVGDKRWTAAAIRIQSALDSENKYLALTHSA